MSDIQVFIQDFLSRATKGEAEMPPSLVDEFKEACGQALEKQFSRIDCYNWLKNNNHPIPDKSACTYCPFNSNSSWYTG